METKNNNFDTQTTMQKNELNELLKKRDRERFLRELTDLERQESACWTGILWSIISFLIVEPLLATIAIWYLWDQVKNAFTQGMLIQNLSSNMKFAAIGIAAMFTLTSLNLIYRLWKISSLKKQITKIKEEIAHLG